MVVRNVSSQATFSKRLAQYNHKTSIRDLPFPLHEAGALRSLRRRQAFPARRGGCRSPQIGDEVGLRAVRQEALEVRAHERDTDSKTVALTELERNVR
jgi:hypothetical protein